MFDTSYTDPEVVKLVGLDNVLFQNFKNDVAFTVNNQRIVLSEHQSTINPNMPLRDLLYIAREYEKIIPVRDRYRSSLIKIPTPKFFVFYNGTEDYPEEQILNPSDAFYDQEDEIGLQLTVKVININPEKHHKILEKCKVLQEYSTFVETTRKYPNDKTQLEMAVKECIKNGILADYLLRKSSEVINMLMAEYDYEMDMEVKMEEAAKKAAKEATAKAKKEAKEATAKIKKEAKEATAKIKKEAKDNADKKFVEYVEKAAKNFHVSIKEACQKLEESYDRYLEIKKQL